MCIHIYIYIRIMYMYMYTIIVIIMITPAACRKIAAPPHGSHRKLLVDYTRSP